MLNGFLTLSLGRISYCNSSSSSLLLIGESAMTVVDQTLSRVVGIFLPGALSGLMSWTLGMNSGTSGLSRVSVCVDASFVSIVCLSAAALFALLT